MQKILPLPEEVINQIAAGEVIEHSASVLKELLDNAIDASARAIEIRMKAGGQLLISVEDDGIGMSREDLELCLLRHATSKLRAVSDLESLQTMGFRGEALAAIASISKIEIRTCSEQGEGSLLRAAGGSIEELSFCARRRGTSIQVQSLFYNAPARRKFQKSIATSRKQMIRVTESIALAHPQISFVVWSDDQLLFEWNESNWKERIEMILGRQRCSEGIWFEEEAGKGWLGSCESARGTRGAQHFFLNRRSLFSPLVLRALKQGYGTRIAEHDHPRWVVFLEKDPSQFDVNVHPQKKEVRFKEEREVFQTICSWVQQVFTPYSIPQQFTPFECRLTESIAQSSADFGRLCEEPLIFNTLSSEPVLFESPTGKALMVLESFLLAEREEKLFLVDLRGAYELYVQMSKDVQSLLWPLVISVEEEESAPSLMDALSFFSVEGRQVGPCHLAIDGIPSWLEMKEASSFFSEVQKGLEQKVSLPQILHRFCQTTTKSFSLEEAFFLWTQGGSSIETLIELKDLEKLIFEKRGKSRSF